MITGRSASRSSAPARSIADASATGPVPGLGSGSASGGRGASEKTSFATILDDVRRNAARRYLTGTDKVGQAGLEGKARPPNDGVKLIAAASSVENAL